VEDGWRVVAQLAVGAALATTLVLAALTVGAWVGG
jgi:hypothetical protein